MKKIYSVFSLIALLIFSTPNLIFSQDSLTFSSNEIAQEEITNDSSDADTLNYVVGNKEIKIYDEDDETSVEIVEKEKEEDDDFYLKARYKHHKFKGHWAGFEFGLNNYVDENFSTSRSAESEFLDINTGKSWNFNVNFMQFSQGFGSSRVGMLTGMGFEWNNYHFSNQNSIIKEDGKIAALPLQYVPSKNRLQTLYLNIPILFELQITDNKRNMRPFFSVGVVGGLKLYSSTLVKYSENGDKRRISNYDDYYLSSLRYGITARMGYRFVRVYLNYSLSPLFIKDRGPELYPVAFGFSLSF